MSLGVKSLLPLLPTAPADFTEVTAVWTFSDTVSEQNVSVSTAEDDILEGDQTFAVSLTTGNTDVMLDPDAAEVTVADDGMVILIT